MDDDLMIGEFGDSERYDKYCEYCDYGYGTPEDDCYCEDKCGVIACQGQESLKLE